MSASVPVPGVQGVRVLGDVSAEVDEARVLDGVRSAFLQLAAGRAVQTPSAVALLPDGGDVICYPAALGDEGVFAIKVSPYLPPAPGVRERAVVTAWTLLLSTRTGAPLLLVDSAGLTAHRTAATSALAVDALAHPDARRLAVVGAGTIADAHLRYVPRLRDFAQTRLTSRSPSSAARLAAQHPGVVAVDAVADAVEGADVVLLCTSAAEPLVRLAALRPGTVVVSVSSNGDLPHEVDPAAVPDVDVYCDHAPTALSQAGELLLAQRAGWDPSLVRGDLAGLLAGSAPAPRGDRPVLFRSVGLGLEDAAVASLLLDASGR